MAFPLEIEPRDLHSWVLIMWLEVYFGIGELSSSIRFSSYCSHRGNSFNGGTRTEEKITTHYFRVEHCLYLFPLSIGSEPNITAVAPPIRAPILILGLRLSQLECSDAYLSKLSFFF